jgi:hypothetical protein
MSRGVLRRNALCVLAAAVGSATLAWLGLYGYAWTDYEVEARPAFAALVHGHLTEFLQLAPAYGGSLVLRAPFALLSDLWGGGELTVYRLVALPCLLGAAALGVWLVADMRRRGAPPLARAVALGLCVANPLTLSALEVGHPEELLGAALCVAAVLLAGRGRPLWAGLLLGAAIANKEWALLAVGPVILALPARRMLCLTVAAGVAAMVLAPLALVQSGGFLTASGSTAAPSSAIFQPWQLWWFLGHHGPVVRGIFGHLKPGYRTAPPWVGALSHPLIVALALPLTALAWWRQTGARRTASAPGKLLKSAQRGRQTGAWREDETAAWREDETAAAPLGEPAHAGDACVRDALLLLALLMLLRCLLDTWDTSYYMLPFLLALTAWESLGERGLPALALASTAIAWVGFIWLPDHHVSPDAQSALFLVWTLPLTAALAWRLYARRTGAAIAVRDLSAPLAIRRRRSAPWAAR